MRTIAFIFFVITLSGNSLVAQAIPDISIYSHSQPAIPEAAAYEGELQVMRQWKDRTGMNYLLFGKERQHQFENFYTEILRGYHYRCGEDGDCQLVRKIQDFVKNCDLDLDLLIIDQSIYISDLDNDQIAEISFLYKLGCRSDVSPIKLKLLMLEDGEKYAIRGTTFVMNLGGEKNIDPSFYSAPESFLNFATKRWDLYVVEY